MAGYFGFYHYDVFAFTLPERRCQVPQLVGKEVVTITVTDIMWRRRSTRAKSFTWGGYGVVIVIGGVDYMVKYDLDQMPILKEDAKKIFAQVDIGTLVTGTLVWDTRFDPFLHTHGYWKLEDIQSIVRGDGSKALRF